jgi:hypothetical protein
MATWNRFGRSCASAFMGLAALAGSAAAGILAVYGPRGTDTEFLKRSAEGLREHVGAAPAEGSAGALAWRWTPGAVLGPEFSFGQEKSAYFLTEDGVRFGPGFSAKGPAHFGAVAKDAGPAIASSPARAQALKVTRRGDRLLLGYPLPEAGRVSVDVFSLKGARLARWNGRQEAGSHLQALALPEGVQSEVLLVRWRFGDAVQARRVNP